MSERKPQIIMPPRGGGGHRMPLDGMTFTYPGWSKDKEEAEKYYYYYPLLVKGKIQAMQRRQKSHDGDRSHADLVAIDACTATLSYPGWMQDKATAEKYHYSLPSLVKSMMETMRRKQKVHDGDFSHPQLVTLNTTSWSYSGWEKDKAEAEDYHVKYPLRVKRKIMAMQRKQNLFAANKNRSAHPDLVALDTPRWSFNGWEKDKAKAEDLFFNHPSLVRNKICAMKRKQRMHNGDRSHRELVTLDTTKWKYRGWEKDKADAEQYHCNYPSLTSGKITGMQRKQKMHHGDRSHPELVTLDTTKWTYRGWEKDKADAEGHHFNHPNRTSVKISGMQRQQQAHQDGSSRTCPIVIADDAAALEPPRKRQKRGSQKVASRMPTTDSSSKCVVCLKAEKTHAFDCGHACVCQACSAWALQQKRPNKNASASTAPSATCPYCSRPITFAREVSANGVGKNAPSGALIDLSKQA